MGEYDFSGWATRNDLLCADGRTIRKNAFKDQDGEQVPIVYNHDHGNVKSIIGHAILENRDEGVYAYCKLNDTEAGQHAKKVVQHGDVKSLSIWANKLKEIGGDVIHGVIRELSLVLAGANPGATIDFIMAHGEDGDEISGFYANYDEGAIMLYHSAESEKEEKEDKKVAEDIKKSEAEEDNKKVSKAEDEKTVQDVIDSMNEEQKRLMYAMVAYYSEQDEKDNKKEDGGKEEMKHNVFDNEDRVTKNGYLSHSDQEYIVSLAKSSQVGSLQAALDIYAEENNLQHSDIADISGFVQEGKGNITELFPEYKDVRPGMPDLITNDHGWISKVMSKVHKTPFTRIRTRHVDIRNIQALKAKGYKKGEKKTITGNYNLVTRTTDPQTVYVKNALHRDDILDITDMDIVKYQYDIDKMMLSEELATAIMFGDGREDGDEYKIAEDKIRPIWTDDDLYTMHVDIDLAAAKAELQGTNTGANFGDNYVMAEAMINTCLYAREKYKGSGTPDMYITPHKLNVMLLARDLNGRRIYSSKAELTAALNVNEIITVEQMEGKRRTVSTNDGTKTKELLCLIANLGDYSMGSSKGGEITHFSQFDIDFNQQKSLLETRVSGALTRIQSAIAVEEDVTV